MEHAVRESLAAGKRTSWNRALILHRQLLCNRYAWRCEAVVGRQQEERNSYQRLKTGQSARNVGLPSESTHPDREEPHDDRSCSGRQVWMKEY